MEQNTGTSTKMNRASEPGCIKIENPQKKDHAKPPENSHGLCLANPCRVGLVGGVGASKTTTLLNCIARCAEWKPFEHIYLMGPSHCVEDMNASSCVPSMPLASVVATLGGRGGSSPPPGSGTVSTGVGDSPTLPELGSLVTIGSFSVASPSTDKWLGKCRDPYVEIAWT